MSNRFPTSSFPFQPSSFFASVLTSYHLSAISATHEVFSDKVASNLSLNKLNLVKGLTETVPDDSVYAFLETLHGGRATGLEDAFSEEQITLSSFFASQLVDVPRTFLKSKSLFTPTARLPKQKLINLLMRHGLRLRTVKTYSLALSQLTRVGASSPARDVRGSSWRSFYIALTNSTLQMNAQNVTLNNLCDPKRSYTDTRNVRFSLSKYSILKQEPSQTLLFNRLSDFIPLFSFFIKKVDKNKRKHSRGKSGKYQIIWKYVPRYKRLLIVLR
jgi:hypothetical protein